MSSEVNKISSGSQGILWNSCVPKVSGKSFAGYLEEMLVQFKVKTINPAEGTIIFAEEDKGETTYFISQGQVEISCKSVDSGKKVLAVLGSGELFGEMALFDQQRRSATAISRKDCKLYVVSKAQSQKLFRDIPELSMWMLNSLVRRLRRTDRTLTQMVQVHEVNRKILAGQKAERKRLGRDLHDGPAQAFADYVMRLQIIERFVKNKPETAIDEIKELRSIIMNGLDQVREMINNIHPRELEVEGLSGAIENFAARVCETSEIKYEIQIVGLPDCLDPSLEAALYCIVQEAVNNVKKHGEAKNIKIEIEDCEGNLLLSISDDGKGFNVQKLMNNYCSGTSFGLSSMEDRARLAGGEMNIQSTPGKGTTLFFSIPLKSQNKGDL